MGCVAQIVREGPVTASGATQRQTGEAGDDGTDRRCVDASSAQAQGTRTAVAVDPDAIDDLADEIATLSAHIHAATHQLLVLIAEFDGLRGWELAGYSNCARWLAARTG